MENKWLAGALMKVSKSAESYGAKVDKESEAGTFGTTKFVAAGVLGAAATAAIGGATFTFLGPGIDRGSMSNFIGTALCYTTLFAFCAPLAGVLASPWVSKKISGAAQGVAASARGLSNSFGIEEPPTIDFGKRRTDKPLSTEPLAKAKSTI